MTAVGGDAHRGVSRPVLGAAWSWTRAALSLAAAGIGVYQVFVGHRLEAVFSFFMAATFLLTVACERTLASAREEGTGVPACGTALLACTGAVIGAALALGVTVAVRAR